MVNWNEVCSWLENHGHITHDWDHVMVHDDGIYCKDDVENTMISVFKKNSGELVAFVGILTPNMSVGGDTCVFVETEWDVIDYLTDNMQRLYDELTRKFTEV